MICMANGIPNKCRGSSNRDSARSSSCSRPFGHFGTSHQLTGCMRNGANINLRPTSLRNTTMLAAPKFETIKDSFETLLQVQSALRSNGLVRDSADNDALATATGLGVALRVCHDAMVPRIMPLSDTGICLPVSILSWSGPAQCDVKTAGTNPIAAMRAGVEQFDRGCWYVLPAGFAHAWQRVNATVSCMRLNCMAAWHEGGT